LRHINCEIKKYIQSKENFKNFFFSKMSNINHYTGDLIIPFIQLLPLKYIEQLNIIKV